MQENLDDCLKQEETTPVSFKSGTTTLAVSEKTDTEDCTTMKSTTKYLSITIIFLAIGLVSIGLYGKYEN